jgi:hypothetical protein
MSKGSKSFVTYEASAMVMCEMPCASEPLKRFEQSFLLPRIILRPRFGNRFRAKEGRIPPLRHTTLRVHSLPIPSLPENKRDVLILCCREGNGKNGRFFKVVTKFLEPFAMRYPTHNPTHRLGCLVRLPRSLAVPAVL